MSEPTYSVERYYNSDRFNKGFAVLRRDTLGNTTVFGVFPTEENANACVSFFSMEKRIETLSSNIRELVEKLRKVQNG